jgi:hypothetical protein
MAFRFFRNIVMEVGAVAEESVKRYIIRKASRARKRNEDCDMEDDGMDMEMGGEDVFVKDISLLISVSPSKETVGIVLKREELRLYPPLHKMV